MVAIAGYWDALQDVDSSPACPPRCAVALGPDGRRAGRCHADRRLQSNDLTVAQARAYLLDRINTARVNHGVRSVAVDTRVADIAQARSEDMATNHYFAHLSTSAWIGMFTSRGISWSKLGEILAENDWPSVGDSADEAMRQWRNSSVHWSILTDNAYNYAGVGVAQDSQERHVDLDRRVREGIDRFQRRGAERRLHRRPGAALQPCLSEGQGQLGGNARQRAIRDYRLQFRVNGHRWRTLLRATTRTHKAKRVRVGKTIEFRVRARDVNFVKGDWTLSSVISVQ